ncbi:NUDIX domain-containing protein [Ornithinibacillus sp. JPR2-1]|uniref:NUDIX hydrolase n=1 Tax=Ornithinibacillus sp. JPR2-1 TaxID=2094019 RepID=UPI0031DDEB3E
MIREVREETGYVHCQVKRKIGTVIERKLDNDNGEAVFQMTSHYYLCDLLRDDKVAQQLDDYEAEQAFRLKWVTLDKAIKQNESLMVYLDKNDWIVRETLVLKELREILEVKK